MAGFCRFKTWDIILDTQTERPIEKELSRILMSHGSPFKFATIDREKRKVIVYTTDPRCIPTKKEE